MTVFCRYLLTVSKANVAATRLTSIRLVSTRKEFDFWRNRSGRFTREDADELIAGYVNYGWIYFITITWLYDSFWKSSFISMNQCGCSFVWYFTSSINLRWILSIDRNQKWTVEDEETAIHYKKVIRLLACFALCAWTFFNVDVLQNCVNCVYRFSQGWSCSRYSDLLLSPFQAFGVNVIVSEGKKLSVGDIVLVRGTPAKEILYREDILSPANRILRVAAVEGDSILYNGCEIVIRKDHVWVRALVQSELEGKFGGSWNRLF